MAEALSETNVNEVNDEVHESIGIMRNDLRNLRVTGNHAKHLKTY